MLFCPLKNVCPWDNFESDLVKLAVCPLVPSIENFLRQLIGCFLSPAKNSNGVRFSLSPSLEDNEKLTQSQFLGSPDLDQPYWRVVNPSYDALSLQCVKL